MKTFMYWFSVVLSIAAVIIVNLVFDPRIGVVWEFMLCLLIIILPSILFSFIEKFFPKKWYGEDKKLFKERRFEYGLFKKIKIKKWKDNVPQFLKIDNINRSIDNNNEINVAYINNFIVETRRGEFIHLLDIIFGILAMLFLPQVYFFKYSLPIILVWIFFNSLSILIQRYNRPRLQKLLKRMEKYTNKPNEATTDDSLLEEENVKMES